MSIVRRGQVVDTDGSPSERATRRLEREGFSMPRKPAHEIPSLPEDITVLSDEDLMLLFTALTSWADYAGTRAAAAMVDERAAESNLEIQEARTLLNSHDPKSKSPVTFAKAQRLLDEEVSEHRTKYEAAYAYRKLVEVLAANTERDAAAVSRELTRRTKNYGVEQRASRFSA